MKLMMALTMMLVSILGISGGTHLELHAPTSWQLFGTHLMYLSVVSCALWFGYSLALLLTALFTALDMDTTKSPPTVEVPERQ